MVSTPASDPVSNADKSALQDFERLQEAASFVRDFTGRQMTIMKQYYDSSVKPVSYAEGEKVLVYNPKKKRGHFAKWVVSLHGPTVVQCKLNQSNYVLRKGNGKCVVVHVDRMCKLPIPSLDVEPSVESSDSHMHTRQNNETTILSHKWRRTQPATDVSSIHPAEATNCGDRGDSISSVDKAKDNQSNVINTAINTAAKAVSGSHDTCQTPEQASQSTGDMGDAAVERTGQAGKLQPINAGRRKHSHNMPWHYVNTISSLLIGRLESRLCVVPGKACRAACTCIRKPFAASEVYTSDVYSFCRCNIVAVKPTKMCGLGAVA